MKKLFTLMTACALMLSVLAGCGNSGSSSTLSTGGAGSEPVDSSTPAASGNFRTVEEIKESGKLIVLTNASFEPYEYVQAGEIKGVDMDLAQMIADELGVELEIVDMDFDLLVDALKAGRGDLIAAGMGYKEDRAKQVDFSIQYVLNGHLVIVPADSDDIKTVEDLDGKTIAVQEGTTADDFARDEVEGADVQSFKDAVAAGTAVSTGRADCAIMDIKPAEGIVANSNGALKTVEGLQLSDEDMCMAVGKGNTGLLDVVNKVLQDAKDSGKIDELVEFHMDNTAS